MPTIAVVVPTLDEEAHLPRLFDALASGPPDDRPEEVIVVDGGSADRTVEIARQRGARVLSGPRGRGPQLALGAGVATADVLVFLHGDCWPDPGALRALRRAFHQRPWVAAGLVQRIEANALFFRCVERFANARVRLGIVYGDSALCVRRADYAAVGGFRAQPLFEDLDLSRRLRRRGPVRLITGATVRVSPRRWEREGPWRTTLRNWVLTAGYVLGVDPTRLVRYYRSSGSGRGT